MTPDCGGARYPRHGKHASLALATGRPNSASPLAQGPTRRCRPARPDQRATRRPHTTVDPARRRCSAWTVRFMSCPITAGLHAGRSGTRPRSPSDGTSGPTARELALQPIGGCRRVGRSALQEVLVVRWGSERWPDQSGFRRVMTSTLGVSVAPRGIRQPQSPPPAAPIPSSNGSKTSAVTSSKELSPRGDRR